MSVQEVLEKARELSTEERMELIKALVDILMESAPTAHRHSLREFRGIGSHLDDGIDAQQHIDQLRDEWGAQ